jgi:hypothetical protein
MKISRKKFMKNVTAVFIISPKHSHKIYISPTMNQSKQTLDTRADEP